LAAELLAIDYDLVCFTTLFLISLCSFIMQ
jgi:hypothetical protein